MIKECFFFVDARNLMRAQFWQTLRSVSLNKSKQKLHFWTLELAFMLLLTFSGWIWGNYFFSLSLSLRGEELGRHFYCPYLSPEVIVNLTRKVKGHFVALIEVTMLLITWISGKRMNTFIMRNLKSIVCIAYDKGYLRIAIQVWKFEKICKKLRLKMMTKW